MPTEDRFQKLEEHVIDIHKQQASLMTKMDIHHENMKSVMASQKETIDINGKRICDLETAKVKIVAFALGVAMVSGTGVQALVSWVKTNI